MKRTTLAVALATGALAIPAMALAQGSGDQAPRRGHDCPNHDGGGSSSGGGSGSSTTL